MHIHSKLREIHSTKIKQYVFGCIALGWLYILMLLLEPNIFLQIAPIPRPCPFAATYAHPCPHIA